MIYSKAIFDLASSNVWCDLKVFIFESWSAISISVQTRFPIYLPPWKEISTFPVWYFHRFEFGLIWSTYISFVTLFLKQLKLLYKHESEVQYFDVIINFRVIYGSLKVNLNSSSVIFGDMWSRCSIFLYLKLWPFEVIVGDMWNNVQYFDI